MEEYTYVKYFSPVRTPEGGEWHPIFTDEDPGSLIK